MKRGVNRLEIHMVRGLYVVIFALMVIIMLSCTDITTNVLNKNNEPFLLSPLLWVVTNIPKWQAGLWQPG